MAETTHCPKTKPLTHFRLRALMEEPYSQKEAEAAVGLRTDNGSRAEGSTVDEAQDVAMDVEMDTSQAAV